MKKIVLADKNLTIAFINITSELNSDSLTINPTELCFSTTFIEATLIIIINLK